MQLNVNGRMISIDADPQMPLLWALRDLAGLNRHQIRLRHCRLRRLYRAD